MTTQTTLALIDIQREYVTPGRPFHLEGIGPSLEQARLLLAQAREAGWRVIHVQHLQDGAVFNRDDAHAAFIDGFEPLAGEFLVTKAKLSAFTSPAFLESLPPADGEVLIAGYGSTMCCMATIVDAPLFGRKFTFVSDASWARSPGAAFTEAETHRHATAIIGIHGILSTTAALLARPVPQAA